jgi:putative transposase
MVLIRASVGALVREGTPMLKVVQEAAEPSTTGGIGGVGGSLLDEIVRDGARAMLAAALQAEVAAYIDAHVDQVDERGHRLVVRNGYHAEREVTTAAGAVPMRAPRVNDKRVDEATGERMRFSLAILPAWARKSPTVAGVLPLLYLHGLSSGDFTPALEQFLGSGAGLSPTTITRLTSQWQDEAAAFNKRRWPTPTTSTWVDGIHLKVRLEQDKVCLLVIIGVRADGIKELVALADGFRESSESWADLLRSCKRRGMRAPVLAVGDGALGSGRRCARCSPTPRSSRAGSTSRRTSWRPCRSPRIRARRRHWRRSTTPRTRPCTQSGPGVRGRLRSQVAKGGRQDHRARRCAAGVLRLPGRALDPPAHYESH